MTFTESVFEGLKTQGRVFNARKKPVEVEVFGPLNLWKTIETREGTLTAEPGDYIIRGVDGEVYPIDPDVFEETYEVVDE